MKAKIFSSIIFLSVGLVSNAQDTHWSQFDLSPLALNPAQAGVQADIRAVGNYRTQWTTLGKPYNTMGAAGDWRVLKKSDRPVWLGVGLQAYSDKAGDGQLGTFMGNLSLSGVVPVDKSLFSAGMMLGYNQKSVVSSNFQWESQFDGFKYDGQLASNETSITPSFSYLNTAAGVNWYYSKTEHYMTANDELKANVGFSVFHFNGPKQSYRKVMGEKLFAKMVFYGNFSYGIPNSKICLLPSFVVYMQGPSKEINFGTLFKYIITEASHYTHIKKPCALSLGGFYRAGDAFIAQMFFEFDKYSLGFAYDLNLSKFKAATKSTGGFEVNFRYNIIRQGGNKSRV